MTAPYYGIVEDIPTKIWDCIIVGAGILGCSTAKYLKESHPDWDILLVDKFLAAGQGNTIKSNAAYRNIFDTGLNIHLAKASVDFYKQVEKKGINLGLKEIGYLWLLSKTQYEKRLEPSIQDLEHPYQTISFLQFLERNNIPIKIFTKDQLRTLFPELKINFSSSDKLLDGIHLPLENIECGLQGIECGSLSPDLLVKYYETEFKKLGGITLYSTLVSNLLLKEKGGRFDPDYIHTVWRSSELGALELTNVESGQITIIETKRVLLATGAWINQLLEPMGINTPIKPKKRQLFRIFNLDEFVKKEGFNHLLTFPFLILPVGGIFIKPIPEAGAIDVGCSDDIQRRFEISSPREVATDNPTLDNPKGEKEFYSLNLQPILESYFPSVFKASLTMETPSAGMYAYSIDKFPVIDQNPMLKNLFYVSGASGSGIMKADSIARTTAALVSEQERVELYDGYIINVRDFSIDKRNLPKETLVL